MVSSPSGNANGRPPRWLIYTIVGLLALAIIIAVAGGCRPDAPRDRPAAGDTVAADTTADTAATVDSVAVDTTLDNLPPDEELTAADTIITPEDSALRRRRAAPLPPGRPVGLNKYPADKWCSGMFTGTLANFTPKLAGGVLRRAEFCGIVVAAALPRAAVTEGGRTPGVFQLSRAKAACDDMARTLNGVTKAQRDRLKFLQGIDEPQAHSWKQPARAADVAAFFRHCKSKMPWLPMAIRLSATAGWAKDIPASSWSGVDRWMAQWHKRKGPKSLSPPARQKAYYDAERAQAKKYGGDIIPAVNIRDLDGANSNSYASPDEIRTHVGAAIRYPAACMVTLWWWDTRLVNTSALQTAWRDVVRLARSQPVIQC